MVARSSGANSMGHIPPPPPRPRTNPRKELEKDLQKNNPAVKDAWEKYQLVLKLAMPSGAIVSKPKPPKGQRHRNIETFMINQHLLKMIAKQHSTMYLTGKTMISDETIRKNNPGVQEAWERYQLLLELARPSPEDLPREYDRITQDLPCAAYKKGELYYLYDGDKWKGKSILTKDEANECVISFWRNR